MEQIDTLLNGNKIVQDTDGFMFGIDAVLLAHFALGQIKKNDKVIDLCTGTGIVPLLQEKAVPAEVTFTAVEIQKKYARLAQKSVELNGLADKIKIIQGDIKNVAQLFTKHSFNVITCNPPYMICEQGKSNPNDEKAIARHEVCCTLADVCNAVDFLLHTHGSFFMIHKATRLPEIFDCLLEHKMEPKRMQLIQPFEGEEANLVLVEARKNASKGLTVCPPIIVRQSEGAHKNEYTEQVQAIYKRMSEARM